MRSSKADIAKDSEVRNFLKSNGMESLVSDAIMRGSQQSDFHPINVNGKSARSSSVGRNDFLKESANQVLTNKGQ